jgi:hypothetical protein
MPPLLLICALTLWLVLNVLAVAVCRHAARAEDIHLSLLAAWCEAGGEARRPRRLHRPRIGRARWRARCRRDADARRALPARRHRAV